MSGRPKLTEQGRAEVLRIGHQRRILTKLIAELQDERRALPDNKTLASIAGCSPKVVTRILNGDPYRRQHPEDKRTRAA